MDVELDAPSECRHSEVDAGRPAVRAGRASRTWCSIGMPRRRRASARTTSGCDSNGTAAELGQVAQEQRPCHDGRDGRAVFPMALSSIDLDSPVVEELVQHREVIERSRDRRRGRTPTEPTTRAPTRRPVHAGRPPGARWSGGSAHRPPASPSRRGGSRSGSLRLPASDGDPPERAGSRAGDEAARDERRTGRRSAAATSRGVD